MVGRLRGQPKIFDPSFFILFPGPPCSQEIEEERKAENDAMAAAWKAKGKGKEKAIEPTDGADEAEAAPKKTKKSAKRAVVDSEDEEPVVEPAPTTKKGGKKGKKAAPVVED